MRRVSAWVSDKLGDGNVAGEAITLTRDSVTVPITAILGRVSPESEALADGRVNLETEPADFLIAPGDYDFGDGPVEPQRGDRVVFDGRTYEATERDGEPVFRPDSQYRNRFRVRTIRVAG
jgi:hypothetical protein